MTQFKSDFLNELEARGLLNQCTDIEKLDEKLVIKKTQSGDKDWYRVICGNYEKRDLAEGSLDKIYAVTGYTSILNYG
jgi:septal ring-binding cell division protein DamX